MPSSPDPGRSSRRGRAVAVVALAALAAVPAATAKGVRAARSMPQIPVEIGRTIDPPADLLAFAADLAAAARAEDVEAVASVVADEVTMVRGNLDLAVPRTGIRTELSSTDAAEILRAIGIAAAGGRPAEGDGDRTFVAAGLVHVAASLEHPTWGRDPLVVGGFCTYRGFRWDAARVAELVGTGRSAFGGRVAEPTPVRIRPRPDARSVETLRAGQLAILAENDDDPAGWRTIRLGDDGTGFVPEGALLPLAADGVCFLPDVAGGWLLAAVAATRR